MKIIRQLIILAFLMGSIHTYAQLDKPHFISFNVGTNLPLGDYKKLDSIAGGSAENGFSYSIEGALYINRVLGIGANLGVFNNSVDNDEIISQLEKEFGAGNYSIGADDWFNGYLMIGPYLSVGTDKFIVDFKFLGGLMTTKKPTINVSSISNLSASRSAKEVISSNLGFNYGIHLRIKLISKLGLRINAEGFSGKQEFETKIEEIDVNGANTTREEKIEKQISALTLGAGLVLTF